MTVTVCNNCGMSTTGKCWRHTGTPADVRRCDEVPGQHHCWHPTHTLTSNPPITVETCCWCGKEIQNRYAPEPTQHGPFREGQ